MNIVVLSFVYKMTIPIAIIFHIPMLTQQETILLSIIILIFVVS